MMPHQDYMEAQIKHALSCPLNRHAGRVRFSCSDEELVGHDRTAWLIMNFFFHGGAKWFARSFREKYGLPLESEGEEGGEKQ